MQISQAEKNTMASLISEVVTAESILTQTQNLVSEAITRRDAAQKKLDQFIQAIPVSDAPAEVKRGRPRGSKTGVRKLGLPSAEMVATAVEHLNSAPNAALSGTQGEK